MNHSYFKAGGSADRNWPTSHGCVVSLQNHTDTTVAKAVAPPCRRGDAEHPLAENMAAEVGNDCETTAGPQPRIESASGCPVVLMARAAAANLPADSIGGSTGRESSPTPLGSKSSLSGGATIIPCALTSLARSLITNPISHRGQ